MRKTGARHLRSTSDGPVVVFQKIFGLLCGLILERELSFEKTWADSTNVEPRTFAEDAVGSASVCTKIREVALFSRDLRALPSKDTRTSAFYKLGSHLRIFVSHNHPPTQPSS